LLGAAGLLRLMNFNQRVHAPTLGTTLGTGCIALASMIYFSAVGSRLVVHELLIVVFVTLTTPISLMVLVRAAVYREASETEGPSARSAHDPRR
jgi:multicomponent K+:H+ antiporter subunit G